MSLQILTDRITSMLGTDSGLNATIKFDTEEGTIFINSKVVPNTVSNENLDADCTFEVSTKNALKLIDGELNAMMAYMTGKLKIHGNMETAMKIAKTFGGK
jgi:putative sterol carrier protein